MNPRSLERIRDEGIEEGEEGEEEEEEEEDEEEKRRNEL